jgi:hypothetical protein
VTGPVSLTLAGGWLIGSAVLTRPDRPYSLALVVGDAATDGVGLEMESSEALDIDGERIEVRRYRSQKGDGDSMLRSRFYRGAGGLGCSLSASVAPARSEEREIAELLARLSVDPLPPADFSEHELAALAQIGGATAFPGLEGRPTPSDSALVAARRALAARGTLRSGNPGPPELDTGVAILVRAVLAAPGMIAVERSGRDGAESGLVHMSPGVGVLQREVAPGVHRLQPFADAQLGAVLSLSLGLDHRAAPDSPAITLSTGAYAALRNVVAGRPGAAEVAPDVQPLADALESFVAAMRVRVLRRDGRRIVGGEVTWLDAGAAGLGEVEAAAESVRVAPTDGAGVLHRVAERMATRQPVPT